MPIPGPAVAPAGDLVRARLECQRVAPFSSARAAGSITSQTAAAPLIVDSNSSYPIIIRALSNRNPPEGGRPGTTRTGRQVVRAKDVEAPRVPPAERRPVTRRTRGSLRSGTPAGDTQYDGWVTSGPATHLVARIRCR